MKKQRYDRRKELLDIGAQLAAKHGACNVTRRMVARKAGVTDALVSSYFGCAEEAQKKYASHARAHGLKLPTKAEAEAMGVELRRKPRKKKMMTLGQVEALQRQLISP